MAVWLWLIMFLCLSAQKSLDNEPVLVWLKSALVLMTVKPAFNRCLMISTLNLVFFSSLRKTSHMNEYFSCPVCMSWSFSSMCWELREERGRLSCWICTQHSLVKETQHSRPQRPILRMPNTQQFIFLQFCGFSAGQCDINSCRSQHEQHNFLKVTGHLVYQMKKREGNSL